MNIIQTLQKRRTRVPKFDYCNFDGERKPWSWMIFRCQTWIEVKKVLEFAGLERMITPMQKRGGGGMKINGDGWEIVKI